MNEPQARGNPRPEVALPAEGFTDRLAVEIDNYLHSLSVPQLVCLAYGHKWPELIPGMGVPRGFRAVRSQDVTGPGLQGVYKVTEECTREIRARGSRRAGDTCGTVRHSMTLPRGVFDRKGARTYAYDNDAWEIRPAGSRLTRRDFTAEIYRRMGRDLFPDEYEGDAT